MVFSAPPYQFDAATPGTLIARSAFFGQHGYVPDVQDLDTNTNMRATFLAGGPAIRGGTKRGVRSIDLAPTAAFLLDVPAPQHSQGVVRRDVVRTGRRYTPVSIVGLNDFHGQLDPTTYTIDGKAIPVGGAGQLATLFDEEADALPGRTLLLAAGDNVGASPPTSALLDDLPTIDVENAWGLDATSFGNHEFDYGLERILTQQARSDFPWLSANIVAEDTGEAPDWIRPSAVFRVNGVRVGVIGATVRATPELVRTENTEGLEFLDEAERIERESRALRRRGVRVQVVVIHEGATVGANAVDGQPAVPWDGPDQGHHRGARRHDGRPRHRGPHAPRGEHRDRRHPGRRGVQRGRQLLRRAAAGAARRRGMGRRRDPRGQEPGRRPARRRQGDRRRGGRRDGAAAQRGHRHAGPATSCATRRG